jgi:hypothetical protein
MNIETIYSLDEEDYFAYYLYNFSNKKNSIIGRRLWFRFVLFVIACIVVTKGVDNVIAQYGLIATTILAFILFHFSVKWLRKQLRRTIAKTEFKKHLGEIDNVRFTDEYIETINIAGESKLNLSQVKKVDEIGKYYFLKLLSGGALIIPKEKLNNLSEVETAIKEIVSKLGIEHNIDLNWKWE